VLESFVFSVFWHANSGYVVPILSPSNQVNLSSFVRCGLSGVCKLIPTLKEFRRGCCNGFHKQLNQKRVAVLFLRILVCSLSGVHP
jgi:hypothetical protein